MIFAKIHCPCQTSVVAACCAFVFPKYLIVLKEWAKPGNIDNLDLEWHEPCQEEIDFVQELLEKFLVPELNTLKQISAENTMPR